MIEMLPKDILMDDDKIKENKELIDDDDEPEIIEMKSSDSSSENNVDVDNDNDSHCYDSDDLDKKLNQAQLREKINPFH